MRETDLYPPIKNLLEGQGYEVKAEVGTADVVACRGQEPPVIVEIKLRFSLSLYHQALARLRLTDAVYIAVPRPKGKTARRARKDNLTLCRRLGLGLIFVDPRSGAEIVCDPGPYSPRKSKPGQTRLLRAFARLEGDPNTGGATRQGLVTAYRQDALRCAAHLSQHGPTKGADVARATGVPAATRLMRDNHYGWFQKVSLGVYALTHQGQEGLQRWSPQ